MAIKNATLTALKKASTSTPREKAILDILFEYYADPGYTNVAETLHEIKKLFINNLTVSPEPEDIIKPEINVGDYVEDSKGEVYEVIGVDERYWVKFADKDGWIHATTKDSSEISLASEAAITHYLSRKLPDKGD